MDSGIEDLLIACRAQPRSSALQLALMAAAGTSAGPVLDYLATLDPAPYQQAHRRKVAAFLTEGGRDDAAVRWSPSDDATPDPLEPDTNIVMLFGEKNAQAITGDAVPRPPVPADRRLTFGDVGGLDSVKRQINRKIIAPFAKPGLFSAFRKRSGGGVLMYGPPGCGKTMLARATAGEAGAHFIPVAITDILSKWWGESEARLAAIFAEARARKPAVLFFDELEALAGNRRASAQTGSTLVSAFLNEMDGFLGGNDAVLVLGATNTPWAIDSAFRRPGRFDRVLFVPPPDQAARLAILTRLLADRPTAPGLDLTRLAAATSGFSGADLAHLVDTAADFAIEASGGADDITPISRRHLDQARAELRPTTTEWLTNARNYAKYANDGGLYDDVLAFLQQHGK